MFLYWADWQYRDSGKQRWLNEPPLRIYEGTEPIPDTIWLVESTLAYMKQTEEGLRYAQALFIHYMHYNNPIYIRCRELDRVWGRPKYKPIAQSTYLNYIKTAHVLALDAVQRLQAGDKIDIKAVIARDRPGR